MADLNSMIAQGAQFQAPIDPFVQYGRMQQLQQGQQTNALNQMKMDEYVRGQQESNALRQFLPTLSEANRNQLLGYGATGQGVYKTMAEVDKERRLGQQAESTTAMNKSNILKNAVAQTRDAVAGIDPTDAPSYMALRESVLTQYPELAPHMPAAWDANVKQRLITTAASVLEGQKPAAQPTSIAEFERAKRDPGFMKFLQERAAAMRPPAAPRPEQPPVAVVDPATGKQVLVSREEALKGRMTPAAAMEGLAPKEIQQREAKYPQATLAVKSIESSSDRLADDLETLAKHPGLSGISGLIYGIIPAITKDARVALEKYRSILARGGFSELQAMRSASPTGGALGNVSNQENQYLRDAFAAIGRSQDTADLKTALEAAANVARAAKQRVRDAYDMTYDYKSGGATTTGRPAPAAATNIDALLNKYK